MTDTWTAGNRYEPYVGRWSRLVAAEFVPWVGVAPGARWLDVGCGTGALTAAILRLAEPARVIGVDPSSAYVGHVRHRMPDDRVRIAVADAVALGRENDEFDAVVSGLVLNFVPDLPSAMVEMRRVTRPVGVIAAYVWDYAEGMQLMRTFWDAADELDPAARELDERARFPMCRPEPLTELFTTAGLTDVTTRDITVPTHFKDFDDYWTPFLGGQGPAPSYAMSLSEEARAELRDLIHSRLSFDDAGGIPMTARAWAVKGTVPTG